MMTMDEKKQMIVAIKKDMKKWKGIQSSQLPLIHGIIKCKLCDLYRKDISSGSTIVKSDCSRCPLYIIGKGCKDFDSCWLDYINIVKYKLNVRRDDTLKMISEVDKLNLVAFDSYLGKIIIEMLSNLTKVLAYAEAIEVEEDINEI